MISKITLGTAQLGMNYGVSNRVGKPTSQEAIQILKFATSHGINSFDTSPSYGNSEKIIGTFFEKIGRNNSVNIITKIPKIQFSQKSPSFDDVYSKVKKSICASSKRLKINKIPTCLLHNPSDIHNYDGFILKSLFKLKKEGLVDMIGVSTYTPQEVKEFLEIKEFDSIQIPINIFDTRLIKSKLLMKLIKSKKVIFARSVFLQGLFFLESNNIPSYLEIVKKPLNELNKISADYGISIPTIAFTFVRDLKGISSIVIGVESLEQLKTNIKLINSPSLSDEVIKLICKKFQGLPEQVINPSKWIQGK